MTSSIMILVRPNYPSASVAFSNAVAKAAAVGKELMTYRGAIFKLAYSPDGKVIDIWNVVKGFSGKPPTVLRDELGIRSVELICDVTAIIAAKPGWYIGENYGFPNASCIIDVNGVTNQGEPRWGASGTDYKNVINLFRKVAAGQLRPGNGHDEWDCAVRR